MGGLREMLARIDATLPHLATAARIADMRRDLEGQISEMRRDLEGQIADLRTDLGSQIADLRGRMNYVPTAWQMMTGIVAGQVTLAAMLAAIVFGVLRVTGRG